MALIDKLNAIGNAIREKNGTTALIPLADMPQAILDIVSGGGASYTSIVYNADDTITLLDKDGTEHTMACEYDNDKLISVTYDGKTIPIGYEGDVLVSVGNTAVDMANVPNAPQTTATTIKADSCVSSVVLPVIVPTATANINSNLVADGSVDLEE